jgi:hypothetical protein
LICEFAGDLARSENRINIGKSALPMPNAREDFDFAVPSLDGKQSDRRSQMSGRARRKLKPKKFSKSAYLFMSGSLRNDLLPGQVQPQVVPPAPMAIRRTALRQGGRGNRQEDNPMSTSAAQPFVFVDEPPKQETKKEKIARLKKQAGLSKAKAEGSLIIQIQNSELYDWNPTKRMTLLVLAFGHRTNENAFVPDDMPDYLKNDMIGWCDMAQWRLAQRVGITEDHMNTVLGELEADKAIFVRSWTDSNNAEHNQYMVNESVIRLTQRPEHKRDSKRPPRYKKKRGANKGSFSSTNQPNKRGFDQNLLEEFGAEEVPAVPEPDEVME